MQNYPREEQWRFLAGGVEEHAMSHDSNESHEKRQQHIKGHTMKKYE